MNLKVDREEVIACLTKFGYNPSNISVADNQYLLPTEKSIQDFGRRYYNFLSGTGLSTWAEDVWDCDDFSLVAKAFACIDSALWKKETGNFDCGIAFGMAWVLTVNGGHAINMALSKDVNNQLQISYYEPQIQQTPEFKLNTSNICLLKQSPESFLYPLWCYL